MAKHSPTPAPHAPSETSPIDGASPALPLQTNSPDPAPTTKPKHTHKAKRKGKGKTKPRTTGRKTKPIPTDVEALREQAYTKAPRKKKHVQDSTPPTINPNTPTRRGKRGSYDRLTYKQEKFCLAMITAPSAVAAYRRVYNASGMKDGTAYSQACILLKNGKVAERISQLKAQAAAQTTLSRSWVLEHLMDHATVCLGKKRVKIARASKDGDVHEVEVTALDQSAANRALELLGKEAGMFVDRREVGGPGDFARMGDEELLRFIRDQQREIESRTIDLTPEDTKAA